MSVAKKTFTVCKMPKDGNCLFHSISFHMYRTKCLHNGKKPVNKAQPDSDSTMKWWKELMLARVRCEYPEEYNQYESDTKDLVQSNNMWDHPLMDYVPLVISGLLNVHVCIYIRDTTTTYKLIYSSNTEEADAPTWNFLLHRDHYDVLLPKTQIELENKMENKLETNNIDTDEKEDDDKKSRRCEQMLTRTRRCMNHVHGSKTNYCLKHLK